MTQPTCMDCGGPRTGKRRCRACHDVATRAFAASMAEIAISAPPPRTVDWCTQCERRVSTAEAARCGSPWCGAKGAA